MITDIYMYMLACFGKCLHKSKFVKTVPTRETPEPGHSPVNPVTGGSPCDGITPLVSSHTLEKIKMSASQSAVLHRPLTFTFPYVVVYTIRMPVFYHECNASYSNTSNWTHVHGKHVGKSRRRANTHGATPNLRTHPQQHG